MSFNYLMDTFDGSIGCEVNTSEIANLPPLYNGKLKNDLNSAPDVSMQRLEQQFKFSNCENFTSPDLDEKKLRFSEKLKVLLKNGGGKGEKLELTDPYAFSEIDSQYGGSLNKALNNVEQCMGKISPPNPKIGNATTQSIMHSRSVRPPSSISELIEDKDCNGEITNSINESKQEKLSKMSVPKYATNNAVVTNLNQTAFKLQGNLMKGMSGLKNGRTLPSVQLPSHNKPILNKLLGKSKLQSLKPTNANSVKGGKNTPSGKPFGFGQSQMHKQGSGKIEKKILDGKQRSFPKGKSLLNQLQKTALMSRPMGQPVRKNPQKAPFFGMVKTNQKDADSTAASNKNRKSLLEESLLGIKNHGNDKNLINGSLNGRTETNCGKMDNLRTLMETGSTTVLTTPKSRTESLDQGKHESLERIWDVRNKLKGLKRDHHHFGLVLNDGDNDENSNSECLLFQNYWFSVCNDYDSVSNNDRRRDMKLSQLKVELRHKIKQLQWRYKDEYRDRVVELLVESARKQPNLTAFLIRLENSKFNNRKKVSRVKPFNLLKPVLCSFTDPESGQKCEEQAMPCVKYCQQHITCSNDQLLFTACSARRSDNSTCRAAVLNQNWENPLCLQHKRLENMSEIPKKVINSKPMSRPSQPRKRSRSSTGSSSRSGRSRKRKRPAQKEKKEMSSDVVTSSGIANGSSSAFPFVKQGDDENDALKRQNALTKITPQIISKCDIDESQEVEVGEEVLAMAADLPLELATQATKLLEEHDFTNVLNHIPADAFNDLFTGKFAESAPQQSEEDEIPILGSLCHEDKEEYEPTPQETEELERALEAVDKDVKSLEKLSQTQGILDTLLDEQTIAQTLAQLPEVTASLEVPQTLVPVFYQNGFSNINQLEQTLHDVNKSLTQTVLLNQGTEGLSNHFVNNLTIPNHADVLQS